VTMLRPDRHLDVTYERAEGRVSRMFPESEPYKHHRLQGHTTLEKEPHINSFVGQGDGYDLMCKASASSKIFPSVRSIDQPEIVLQMCNCDVIRTSRIFHHEFQALY